MGRKGKSAGRRLSVITVDQVISGASNVLIALLAARVLGVGAFGLFGIVFLVYMILIGVTRALVCDPVLVHAQEAEQRVGEVIGATCLLAAALALALAAVALGVQSLDGALGEALLVLAACLPLLVAQDLGRYLSFAGQRPGFAVALDVVWLVALLGAIAALLATGTHTLTAFIGAWAGSGALAGLMLFWRHPPRRARATISWLRYTWGFSWRFLVSYTSTQGAALGASSGIGALAGARALGGVNGAVLLARPFTTFQVAAIASSIGEITRARATGTRVRRHAALTSALCAAVALANGAAMVALPGSLGRLALGASWPAARALLAPTAAQILCLALLTGPQAGLLGVRAIRRAMAINVASTLVVLVAAIAGAALDGALGALWAIAAGQGALMLAWWSSFIAATRPSEAVATVGAVSPVASVSVASPPPA